MEVSIICNTYNHEKYIEDALKGFVMQQTTFPFEVLIHDDASTDGTAAIIRKYEKKYPELIKPIYQKVNQYSQGIKITQTFQLPRAGGRYIATCEGDDYWTDPKKLQKQYEAMEAHAEVDLCATAADLEEAVSGNIYGESMALPETGIISAKQIISIGGGIVATSSLFGRKEFYMNWLPFYQLLPYDYTAEINGALRGGLLFLAEKMVVYRARVPGGWTCRMKRNLTGKINHMNRQIDMLHQLDKDTKKKYHICIQRKIFTLYCKIVFLSFKRFLGHQGDI
jgi:glycosyltransferase involved in cell wall biosynthesis